MAVTYGFYNSLNGDRSYNALEMSRIFDGIISDGIFEKFEDAFEVVSANSGRMIYIKSGRAWFNNSWIYNDAIYPIMVDESELNQYRIDAIVVEINSSISTRENSIKIIKGTPSSSDPQKPEMENSETVKQYPLAYISLSPQQTIVTDDNIYDNRGSDDCPYIDCILDQMDVENIVSQWVDEFEEWFTTWKSSKQIEFESFVSYLNDSALTESEIGELQAQINNKEEKGTMLAGVLKPGIKSMTFTDTSITDLSIITIYSSPYGLRMINAQQGNNKLYLSFKDHEEEYQVQVYVRN